MSTVGGKAGQKPMPLKRVRTAQDRLQGVVGTLTFREKDRSRKRVVHKVIHRGSWVIAQNKCRSKGYPQTVDKLWTSLRVVDNMGTVTVRRWYSLGLSVRINR